MRWSMINGSRLWLPGLATLSESIRVAYSILARTHQTTRTSNADRWIPAGTSSWGNMTVGDRSGGRQRTVSRRACNSLWSSCGAAGCRSILPSARRRGRHWLFELLAFAPSSRLVLAARARSSCSQLVLAAGGMIEPEPGAWLPRSNFGNTVIEPSSMRRSPVKVTHGN